MFQVDSKKRYNVYLLKYSLEWNNVELFMVAADIVAFKDEEGKEHIFTGNVGIRIEQIA